MKCRECPDYRECNKTHDLRRYRPKCSKAKEKKVFVWMGVAAVVIMLIYSFKHQLWGL